MKNKIREKKDDLLNKTTAVSSTVCECVKCLLSVYLHMSFFHFSSSTLRVNKRKYLKMRRSQIIWTIFAPSKAGPGILICVKKYSPASATGWRIRVSTATSRGARPPPRRPGTETGPSTTGRRRACLCWRGWQSTDLQRLWQFEMKTDFELNLENR